MAAGQKSNATLKEKTDSVRPSAWEKNDKRSRGFVNDDNGLGLRHSRGACFGGESTTWGGLPGGHLKEELP